MTIKKQIEQKVQSYRDMLVTEFFQKKIPGIRVFITDDSITINGASITGIDMDEYNNLECKFVGMIPVEILPVARQILTEFFENEESFKNRAGVSLYIHYFEKFYTKLTVSDVEKLCVNCNSDTKKDDAGFTEWLVGDSYTTGGNIKYYKKFKSSDFFKYLYKN